MSRPMSRLAPHADPDVKKYACQLMKETGSFAYTRAFFESSKYAARSASARQLHVCSTCALLCPCTLARTRMRRLPRALRQALSMPRTHPGRQDWPRFLASPCALGLEPCRCGQPEGHTRVTHQKMGGHHRMLRALRRLPLTTHVWRLPLTTNLWRAALGCRAQVLRHIAHLGGNPMLEVVSYHPCAILAPSLRCLPPSFLLPHAVSRSHSPSLSVSRSLLLPLRLPHCL